MTKTTIISYDPIKNSYSTVLDWLEKQWGVVFGILLALLMFTTFYHLGSAYIYPWDEARHGVNAYEMLQNNDFIRSTYQYTTDYYNLKTPLSYWVIALSYQVLGYNAFALRFYSALSYILTGLLISLSLKKHHGAVSSLSSLLFFTLSIDLFSLHMARSGDADSMFILFYTIATLTTIRYIENEKPSNLYLASFAFSAAFLTKSFHAGSIVISMAIILLMNKKLRSLSIKTWVFSLLCAIMPIALWAAARYAADGVTFFQKMINYDLLSRSTQAIEGHIGSFFQFIKDLRHYLSVWVMSILVLVGLISSIRTKTTFTPRLISYFVWAVIPIVLFSFVKTKILWYIYPACIALIVLAAVMVEVLNKQQRRSIPIFLFTVAVIIATMIGISGNLKAVTGVFYERDIQIFFQQTITRDADYSGRTCYIDIGDWHQGDLLQAELSGDLHCANGGVDAFLLDESDAMLLVTDYGIFEGNSIVEFETLVSDGTFYLVEK